jgi:hypothetical protein
LLFGLLTAGDYFSLDAPLLCPELILKANSVPIAVVVMAWHAEP